MTKSSRSRHRDKEAANQITNSIKHDAEESSPKFKKMKPRVGSYYQTKVPRFQVQAARKYQSFRPVAEKMSIQHDHLSNEDLKRTDREAEEENDRGSELVTSEQEWLDSTIPNRAGGICTHLGSTKNKADKFINYAHTVLLQRPQEMLTSADNIHESVFCQDMISTYGSTSSGTRHRQKRRAPSEWKPCPSLVRRTHSELPPREEEELLLSYFLSRSSETVELDLRVQLSNGTACKARRVLRKRRHGKRLKQHSVQSSASWRQRLEPTVLWGDLRSDDVIASYPYSINPVTECCEETTRTAALASTEDMKGVWRSILAYSQAMEHAMNIKDENEKENSKKNNNLPRRIEVMNFIRNVYALSIPEETFGSRHVCVEEISTCMHALLDNLAKANDSLAEIFDFLSDNQDGIDMEDLRKLLDEVASTCPVVLEDELSLRKQIDISAKWQEQLDALMSKTEDNDDDENDHLEIALDLAKQARSQLNIRSRGLFLLEKRIEKGHELEKRLAGTNGAMTVKSIGVLVKEANRINLPSRRVRKVKKFHKELECWVERANIAIRSRISLTEIESLISRAESMPLNLSEFVDKLRSRVRMGQSLVARLDAEVPCVYKDGGCTIDEIGWMRNMRIALKDDKKGGTNSYLQEICSEGVRLPVEITCIKLLQTEIDAKSWMAKARKWVNKKPKIEELREHLEKGEILRDRLPVQIKKDWVLDYETELRSTVDTADSWYDEYQPFLEWDNRRSSGRSCMSLEKLRQIVKRGTAIPANVGSTVAKMSKVLEQAEVWYKSNESLLERANAVKNGDTAASLGQSITLSELEDAVSSAASNISVDLEEALALQKIAERIQRWTERAGNAAPIKRSKRVGKGRWPCKASRFRVEDLENLIDEAKYLPIPTNEIVERLKKQLEGIRTWKYKAHKDLKEVANAFCCLRSKIECTHGKPDEQVLCVEKTSKVDEGTDESPPKISVEVKQVDEPLDVDHAQHTIEDHESELDMDEPNREHQTYDSGGTIDKNVVDYLISNLLNESRQTGVVTAEEEVINDLEKISAWCCKSLKALKNSNELLEKRTYQNFNALVTAGKELLTLPDSKPADFDLDLWQILRKSWSTLVEDQLRRLGKLEANRDDFIKWTKTAQSLMAAKEKKITIEAIEQLAEESRKYPSSGDVVQRVQCLSRKVSDWRKTVKAQLYSEQKMNLEEAKRLCDEGDKLKIACQELKSLRNAIRCARGWQIRVKKCKVEQGGLCANEAEKLILEHDKFLIAMAEDVDRIKQAMKGYCLCRRPYEGFMIGCDGCDEWYHGSCIGVSETQADRFEKYLCVRCCVKKVFRNSSTIVAGIIKKWTSDKERRKARQAQYQKHQRKVRKERKDIEKIEGQISELCRAQLTTENNNESLESNSKLLNNADDQSLDYQNFNNQNTNVSENSDPKAEVSSEKTSENKVILQEVPCISNSADGTKSKVLSTEAKEDGNNFQSVEKVEDKEATTTPGNCIPLPPDIEDKITNLRQEISKCRDRIRVLQMMTSERCNLEREEDRCSQQLKVWCIRVRSKVLVPSTTHHAEFSRPLSYGRLSPPMLDVFKDAEVFRIDHFPDVHLIANAFKSICWSSFVMSKLAKKPSLEDIQHVVEISSSINLPDEKAVRMLKSMVQRTIQWQMKVRKCLSPKPGETKPFSLEALKCVDALSSTVPFDVPEAVCLSNAIEDKGTRYCCCGGANDSTFMLSCDKCEKWFHGRCVNVDNGCVLDKWTCPLCKKDGKISSFQVDTENWFDFLNTEDDSSMASSTQEDAPNAPTIEKLWPPFKLLESEEAKEALGIVCVMIPDEAGYVAGLDDALRDNLVSSGNKENHDETPKHADPTTMVSQDMAIQPKRELDNFEELRKQKQARYTVTAQEGNSSDLQTQEFNRTDQEAKIPKGLSPLVKKEAPEAAKSELMKPEATKVTSFASNTSNSSKPIIPCVAESGPSSDKSLSKSHLEIDKEKSGSSLAMERYPEKKEFSSGKSERAESETVGNKILENGSKAVVSDDGSHSIEPVQGKKADEKNFVVEGGNMENIPVVVSPELGGGNEKQVLETENEILRVPCKG